MAAGLRSGTRRNQPGMRIQCYALQLNVSRHWGFRLRFRGAMAAPRPRRRQFQVVTGFRQDFSLPARLPPLQPGAQKRTVTKVLNSLKCQHFRSTMGSALSPFLVHPAMLIPAALERKEPDLCPFWIPWLQCFLHALVNNPLKLLKPSNLRGNKASYRIGPDVLVELRHRLKLLRFPND